MSNPNVHFSLRSPGSARNGWMFRVHVLPRVGEYFGDEEHFFRVTHVVHWSSATIDVHAVQATLPVR